MLHSMVICFQLARLWQRNVFAVQPHGIAPGRPIRLARSAFQLALPSREAPRAHPIPSLVEKSSKAIIDLAARMRETLPVTLIANRSSWVPAQLGVPSVSKHARRSRVLCGGRRTLFAG